MGYPNASYHVFNPNLHECSLTCGLGMVTNASSRLSVLPVHSQASKMNASFPNNSRGEPHIFGWKILSGTVFCASHTISYP